MGLAIGTEPKGSSGALFVTNHGMIASRGRFVLDVVHAREYKRTLTGNDPGPGCLINQIKRYFHEPVKGWSKYYSISRPGCAC